ncbi:ras guanine nucleotide exchange factor domain-containing protein [Powellomyces hirtus]|nr:ras guanine nucleotide exchange factor domain-containing protein [Powellomyces hirtus]
MAQQQLFQSKVDFLVGTLSGLKALKVFLPNDTLGHDAAHAFAVFALAADVMKELEALVEGPKKTRRGTSNLKLDSFRSRSPASSPFTSSDHLSPDDARRAPANAVLLPPTRPWPAPANLPTSPLLNQYRDLSAMLHRAYTTGESMEKIANEMELSPETDAELRKEFDQQMRDAAATATANLGYHGSSHSLLRRCSLSSDESIRTRHDQIVYQILLAASTATVLSFHPQAIAFSLCGIDQKLFAEIRPLDLLRHKPPEQVTRPMQAHAAWFNYLGRLVEFTILAPQTAQDRARTAIHWIYTAIALNELRNFSALQAVVYSLQGVAVSRMKSTWSLVPKKHIAQLKLLDAIVSPLDNYARLRKRHADRTVNRPLVPCLGVYTHDTTYYVSIRKQGGATPAAEANFAALCDEMEHYQNGHKYSVEQLSAIMMLTQPQQTTNLITGSPATSSSKAYTLLTSRASADLAFLEQADDETVTTFITHWLLSRKCYSEKELDALSKTREPKILKNLATNASSGSSDTKRVPTIGEIRDALLPRHHHPNEDPPFITSDMDYLAAHSIAVPPSLLDVSALPIFPPSNTTNNSRASLMDLVRTTVAGRARSTDTLASVPSRRRPSTATSSTSSSSWSDSLKKFINRSKGRK